jgi:hypothetical protein
MVVFGFLRNFSYSFNNSITYRTAHKDTTAVVFKQGGAVATATYKLHLASSSAEAISQSGQRKIIRDSYGTYHLTYISASRVWYSRSTNGGTTWLPEIRLSQYEPPEHCSMFNAGLIRQGLRGSTVHKM